MTTFIIILAPFLCTVTFHRFNDQELLRPFLELSPRVKQESFSVLRIFMCECFGGRGLALWKITDEAFILIFPFQAC